MRGGVERSRVESFEVGVSRLKVTVVGLGVQVCVQHESIMWPSSQDVHLVMVLAK